jgi:glutamate N-acetyltransferase / amino-acid N-acetyltransferase
MGSEHPSLFQPESCVIGMGGRVICRGGEFILDAETEAALVEHMKNAEQIRESTYPNYPPTNNAVEITVDLGLGDEIATVLGSDLTHEYVSINADYRS